MNERFASQVGLWQRRLTYLRSYATRTAPFVSGVVATFVALLLYQALFPPLPSLTLTEVNQSVSATLAAATPAPAYSSLVYQAIQPSIVLIQTQRTGATDNAEDEADEGYGLGTGVVINTNGDILTSLHVITDATTIRLTFADGTEASGQILATQPENDIAVLGASQLPELLVPAILGNPNAMRIGDEAYVVGHPLGLYGSMSAGVISGFDRTFRPPDSEQRLSGLIQIDAAVNPGNSGGPLLNRYGQVVGIVAGLVNPTEESFFIGIGFAVPINVAGGAAGLPPY
ncbi:MAG: trypsin-like peptidase domain-containing protein [Caldilineaceae bacterium]|nr:trypsin-like peptidase domain-containing protein [Caldilineaceae bacterium]